ncbi:SURF4 family-domain-containing protein [Chytriomyces sp. MP71]|nr:SURF4 family-domain-containing protein [Chytriomyces sp. MP71]
MSSVVTQVEEVLDRVGRPLKPYLPVLARFLLVVTFLEDSLRMLTQYGDQKFYLKKHRGFASWGADLFLVFNMAVMVSCSLLAIAKKHTLYAVAGLGSVVLAQGFGYGLVFESSFLFRSLSIVGGLVMLLADAHSSKNRRNTLFAGLPQLSATDQGTYLQLAGRVLLVFLFMSFIFAGEMTIVRGIVALIAFVGCICVVVGFKAKWSAGILILFLSISNVVLNNWWSLHHLHPQRDFQRYDFFQNLSIVGGFLLLVNLGPGGISMDEKKKDY